MPEPDTVPASPAVLKSLARPHGATIAYEKVAGASPGIVFLGGFRSDMSGTKALFLEDYSRRRGRAYLRFDYFGHGHSTAISPKAQSAVGAMTRSRFSMR